MLGDPLTLSISVLVSLPVLLAVLWLAIKKRKGPRFSQYLALRKFCPRQFLLWASVLAGVLFGGDRLLQWAGDASGEIFMHDLMDSGKFLGPLAAAVTLAAPLGEELLFRGFMFRGIADSRAGWIAAILIPNVFWVVLHVQYSWPTMAVIFAMGIVLGMARRFSGSVALPIALHFLWNGFATLSVFFDGGPKT